MQFTKRFIDEMEQAERRARQLCVEQFSRHVLLYANDDRHVSTYVIGRPNSNVFRVEVYVGQRSVTVQGDIDLMSFTGGPHDHRQRIAWVAHSSGSYLSEKASIGCTCDSMVYDHDDRLALLEVLAGRRDDTFSREQARAAYDALRRGEGAQQATIEIHENGYAEGEVGRVMSQRLITAHAAVQCLDRLLRSSQEGVEECLCGQVKPGAACVGS